MCIRDRDKDRTMYTYECKIKTMYNYFITLSSSFEQELHYSFFLCKFQDKLFTKYFFRPLFCIPQYVFFSIYFLTARVSANFNFALLKTCDFGRIDFYFSNVKYDLFFISKLKKCLSYTS